MSYNLKTVPTSQVRILPQALRNVDVTTAGYAQLRDNIAQYGILSPISVTEGTDPETGGLVYNIVDGAHRYTAARDAGAESIPVNIVDADETKRMLMQMSGNLQTIITKPVEYTKQLLKLLNLQQHWDLSDLAKHVNQSVEWLRERLNLLKLDQTIQNLVDTDQLKLTQAYMLARLPVDIQKSLVDDALTMSAAEFQAKVAATKAQLAKDAAAGRKTNPDEFVHKPYLRKMAEIEAERESGNASRSAATQIAAGASSVTEAAEQGFAAGIAWITHSDPASIDADRRKHEAKIASRAAQREEAKKQRQAKSSSDAKRVEMELELYRQGKTKDEVDALLAAGTPV